MSDLLDSHPRITASRELFKDKGNLLNVDQDNYRYHQGNINDFLDSFYESKLLVSDAAGFMLMYRQLLRFPQLTEYIENNSITSVYLERKNRLKTALSRLKARDSGLYHSTEPIESLATSFDVDAVLDELSIIDESIDDLRAIARRHDALKVYYEDLVENRHQTLDSILGALGVSRNAELSSPLKKTSSDDLRKLVGNYDELMTALSNSPYSEYCEAGFEYR